MSKKKKKKICKTNKTNEDDEIVKIQNNLKNSIKTLFISDKKKKAIDEYVQLTTKIREEYAKLQQENNQLKIELHKYKNYVEQLPQIPYHKSYAHYQKPIRKRKHYHDIKQEESDESDSYITEICRRPRKQRKRIIYDDELDGVRDYEPESPSEEEQEDNNEIEVKRKGKFQPKNL